MAERIRKWLKRGELNLGLEVDQAEVRDKLGLSARKAGAPILGKPAATPPNPRVAGGKGDGTSPELLFEYHLNSPKGNSRGIALQAQEPSGGRSDDIEPAALLGD
ncbi:MAG: hypothetical protein COB16_19335 [Rhodobacteraceae bacterium]|nr:MAG: hypothetical protein COB16_19335 [Paracoccaceae bacterium]